MRVSVEIETVRDLADVAGLGLEQVALPLQCSTSLASLKLLGRRPWYKQEVSIFHEVIRGRGVVISRRRLDRLIGRENIRGRPSWTTRSHETVGGDA